MLLASITRSLTDAVASHSVAAVFGLMALDALLPVGGELVMVVAGAIAAGAIAGHPQLLGHELGAGAETYAVLSVGGALGYLVGSLAGWAIGRTVGRDLVERHGRAVHLGPGQMAKAERWFERHGPRAVLLGRLTPLVRSFISIPAGLLGEPLPRYVAMTALGSAIWCFAFAGLGWGLGSSYRSVDRVTHVVEALIVLALLAGAAFLWRARRTRAQPGSSGASPP